MEIDGRLTANEASLSGFSVLLSYSVDGGNSWEPLTLVSTDSNGEFSAVWTPSVTGNYFLRAIYAGNSGYSQVTNVVNFAVLPFKEDSVFSVASNSTLSALAFNSTSQELSFRVSGESGTIGYVDIFVAKSLMSDVSNLIVYFDGNQLASSTESQGDSWLVSFMYRHSVHQVTLSLGAQSSAPEKNPFDMWIIFGTVGAIIAAALVLSFTKMKSKKSTS